MAIGEDAVRNTFSNLYIAPIIITKISEKRHFDKVSDCVIRFSSLYYDSDAYQDARKGVEHVSIDTLDSGIHFFEYILTLFHRAPVKKRLPKGSLIFLRRRSSLRVSGILHPSFCFQRTGS